MENAHPLTERQQKTLEILRRHLKLRGVPASRLEMRASSACATRAAWTRT